MASLPPPATGPAIPTNNGQSLARLWDRLRRARANTQDLRSSTAKLKNSGTRFTQVLADERKLWDENRVEIDEGVDEARSEADLGVADPNYILDELELIRDAIHRADAYWQTFVKAPPADPVERAARLEEIDQLLRSMIVMFAYLTVPDRLRAYLDAQPTGGAVDFHADFCDEITEKEDRDIVLRYLKTCPKSMYGIVEVDSGLVWKISRRLSARLMTYAVALVIFAIGLVGAYAICKLNLGSPFLESRANELVLAYVAVAAGVVPSLPTSGETPRQF